MTFTCSQCGSSEVEVRPYGQTKPQETFNDTAVEEMAPSNKSSKGKRYVHTCQKCGHQDLICVL